MANKMSGQLEYTIASARIAFPGSEIRCDLCPVLDVGRRDYCRLSGEIIRDTTATGMWCPLSVDGQMIGGKAICLNTKVEDAGEL